MSSITYLQFTEDFYQEKKLGAGNCAKVSKIKNRQTRESFALKVAKFEQFQDFSQCINEVEIIRSIKDEAVPKLHHYYLRIDISEGIPSFEIGMIMEYCQQSLQQLINDINNGRSEKFSREQVWNFMKSMIRIFSKMQRLEILHRDIKPGNILIKWKDGKKTYKVCDFGYSVQKSKYSANVITGTEDYVSPRVLKKFKMPNLLIDGITEKDDVYSLGKTILEVIKCRKVTNEEITERLFEILRFNLDENIVSILEHMLDPNENYRWDFIHLENEIKKIEANKIAQIIDLDNSMIEEQQEEIICRSFQLKHYLKQIQSKRMQLAKHIEIQTDQLLELEKRKQFKKIPGRYENETQYLPNQVIQLSDSQTKYYLMERNFKLQNEIFCTIIIGDYMLLGMHKSLGVINLKGNSRKIYILRLISQQKQSMASFNVVKMQESNGNLILIITADFFLHYQIEKFLKQLDYLRDNHNSFLRDKILKEVRINYRSLSSFSERGLNPGSYQIFQMLYHQMNFCTQENCQMNCFEVSQHQFLGVQNPALLGHRDGRISIFGKGMIYQGDESIRQVKSFGNNKLVYTSGSQIKMVEFLEDDSSFPPKNYIYPYNADSQIIHFRIIPKNLNIKDDEQSIIPFIQAYTYDARRIVLGNQMEIIEFEVLQRNAQINQICESSLLWSIEKEQIEGKEEFVVERKFIEKNQKKKGKIGQLYYATSSGLLKSVHEKEKVHRSSLKQPCGVHVTEDKILFANYDGFVQILCAVTEDQKNQEEKANKIKNAALKIKGNIKKTQASNQHQRSFLKTQHGRWRQPNNLSESNPTTYPGSSVLVTQSNYYSSQNQIANGRSRLG